MSCAVTARPDETLSTTTASKRSPGIQQLFARYHPVIGALASRLGVAPGDIDDLRQCVWITVSRCLERIRHGSERAFILSVVRRESGHMRRSYRRRGEVVCSEFDEFMAATPASDQLAEHHQRMKQAEAVLQVLDDGLLKVLLLTELDGASARDIAEQLDIPLGTAKSRLRRARAQCALRCKPNGALPTAWSPS